jgi:hypothetical protein
MNTAGGLWPAVNSTGDLAPDVRQMMIVKTQTAMQEALADIDVSGLLFESCPSQQELTDTLSSMLAMAKSDLVSSEGQVHLLFATPRGPTGTEILKLLREQSTSDTSTGIHGGGDICICAEASAIPLQDVAKAMLGNPAQYESAARRVMTRIDVAWVPFRAKD